MGVFSIQKARAETSASSFFLIFSELVTFYQNQVTTIQDLETKLLINGESVGLRLLHLFWYRERLGRREWALLPLLQLLQKSFWKFAFGRSADLLEQSTEKPNQYMITDHDPLVSKYISVPKELHDLNIASWMAGVLQVFLFESGHKCQVSAHSVTEANYPKKTVFLMIFENLKVESSTQIS